jgi:hypothetical protein
MLNLLGILLVCSGSRAMPQAPDTDSIAIFGTVHAGAFGHLGPHVFNAATGPLRDTLFVGKVAKGTPLAYRFRARPGWDSPHVTFYLYLPVPRESTVVVTGPFTFEVSAHRIPVLTDLNRPLYDLLKQLLTASDPVPVYQRALCATTRLFERVPRDSATLLGAWANELARAAVADPQAERRADSLLGGHDFDLTCRTPSPP